MLSRNQRNGSMYNLTVRHIIFNVSSSLRILYVFSTFAYILIYHVFGYRKEAVRKNPVNSVSWKIRSGKKKIEKQFYKIFVDNFIETLKLLSGGPKFANKHFIADGTLMEEQFHKGNRCQFHLGHNFNWELANIGVSAITSYKMLMVYMPVKNKVFDKLMLKIRSCSGNYMLPATDMKAAMIPHRDSLYLLALVADQVPRRCNQSLLVKFLWQAYAIFTWPRERRSCWKFGGILRADL